MAKQKPQVEKFRKAARESGADQSEDAFNETLKNLAKSPRRAAKTGQHKPGEEAKPKR